MNQPQHTLQRRSFQRSVVAGCGAVRACSVPVLSDDTVLQLSAEHQRAVNRRRRIVVQYDCHGQIGLDFGKWLA